MCERCGASKGWAQEWWFAFHAEELEGVRKWFDGHDGDVCHFGLSVCSLCDTVSIHSLRAEERDDLDDDDHHQHSETPCFHCTVVVVYNHKLDAFLHHAHHHRENCSLSPTSLSRGNRIISTRFLTRIISLPTKLLYIRHLFLLRKVLLSHPDRHQVSSHCLSSLPILSLKRKNDSTLHSGLFSPSP